ncbi:MAG: hypothetical protein DRP08_01360 [Candidatus Aenigmatarchaeota archaeon]|nr:MAG: hypothetical protein DRP08_01360 [Candidatus Aenigmarchaeota archaeon]
MKIFTIIGKEVQEGAVVTEKPLSSNPEIKIKGIVVGERGGRKSPKREAFLPISPDVPLIKEGNTEKVLYGSLGKTRKGAPKLIKERSDDKEKILCVILTRFIRGKVYYYPLDDNFWPSPPGITVLQGFITDGPGRYADWCEQLIQVFSPGDAFKIVHTYWKHPRTHIYIINKDSVAAFLKEEFLSLSETEYKKYVEKYKKFLKQEYSIDPIV